MWADDLRREIQTCARCALSATKRHPLCGEGNVNARIFLVAQAPGEKEDREGRMFIGPSGKVLDELLSEAGVAREEIYMTNLIKCTLPKNRRPKTAEIERCAPYLEKELEAVDPEVVAPMGRHAVNYILKKYGLDVPSKEAFGERCGTLLWTGEKKVLPLYHPAAMLHGPSLEDKMKNDYRKLGVLRADCKWYPLCPMKFYHDRGMLDRTWIELYCKGDWERCVRYAMEQRGQAHPDWMLPDGSIDRRLQ